MSDYRIFRGIIMATISSVGQPPQSEQQCSRALEYRPFHRSLRQPPHTALIVRSIGTIQQQQQFLHNFIRIKIQQQPEQEQLNQVKGSQRKRIVRRKINHHHRHPDDS